ncbi:DUF6268 family outer membrane beta-barrel protein [Moheibacter sediminis]|uniref:DUF6268 domain-containing protein n=1 Tax=Moheibacter sediminis TaxID=1434700 RepID=A0A1W1Z6L9_9FLAO|nr:DUF6268 family outer membrane beta-barrel protein [Moheibacter sediminis]SMC43952.1 hypothetical protein SAMN06296427_102236 [Moheibacter sediminis]
MYKFILTLLTLTSIVPLLAQTDNDPVYVNYYLFPSRDFKEMEGSAVYSQIEANVILPGFNLGENTKVYTNLNYKISSYNFEETNADYLPEQLNDIRLGFIVRHKITENWEAILAPRINLRTDFEEKLSKRDFFPSVHLLGVRTAKNNPDFMYGLGVSYNNEGIKNLVVPLAILQYKNEDMRIYTIIPSFAYFMMTPSPKFEYGLSVNLEAGLFHIDRFSTDNSPNYLSTQNITIAPTIGYQFSKNFWLNVRAGYALPGKYHLLNADFDNIPLTEENSFKGGLYFSGGISLRVKEKAE